MKWCFACSACAGSSGPRSATSSTIPACGCSRPITTATKPTALANRVQAPWRPVSMALHRHHQVAVFPMLNPDTPISEFIPLSTHVSPTVLKTTGGDYLLVWRLGGLPFVGREEWEIEHRHNTFNRMLQTLRAPDFVNVAFWVHDVRRRGRISANSKFDQVFNQSLSDGYYSSLTGQKIMQNELYLTMIYRPIVSGKRFVEKSGDSRQLQSEQDQAIAKVLELAGNVEAVLKDYAPYRLGMYEAKNGVVFSEALEFFGYVLNRIDEPVPVLQAPVYNYLPVSRLMFSAKSGDFVVNTPTGANHFGAILNIKEFTD